MADDPKETTDGRAGRKPPERADGLLSRTDEIMEIQRAGTEDFYRDHTPITPEPAVAPAPPRPSRPRRPAPAPTTPGKSVPEPSFLHGLNLMGLARWCLAGALCCAALAAVLFFWPLTRGAYELATTQENPGRGPGAPSKSNALKELDLDDEAGKAGIKPIPGLGSQPGGGAGGVVDDDDDDDDDTGSGQADISFMIFSTPDGAEVLIDGQSRGETPVGANITCTVGEQVSIEVRHKRYKPWERAIPCRKRNIKVEAKLERR